MLKKIDQKLINFIPNARCLNAGPVPEMATGNVAGVETDVAAVAATRSGARVVTASEAEAVTVRGEAVHGTGILSGGVAPETGTGMTEMIMYTYI